MVLRRLVAIALAGMVATAGSACRRKTEEPSTPATSVTGAVEAKEWDRRAAAAFRPLDGPVRSVGTHEQEWQRATRTSDALRDDIDMALEPVTAVRDRVGRLPALEGAPLVPALYSSSALLYVEWLRALRVGTALPAGALRAQVVLLSERVKVMAARVFDRGRVLLDDALSTPPLPDYVDARLPEEVPQWDREGLAPGPPLQDSASGSPPPGGQGLRADRPSQSFDAWVRAVATAGVPAPEEVAAALAAPDANALRDLAGRFGSAVESLRGVADPQGDREVSTRARLALLLDEEGVRAVQAAVLVAGADGTAAARLSRIGRRLVLVGDRLWPAALGRRAAGFPPGLLVESGP